LKHCGASWKIMGSITKGVTGIFHRLNPSGSTMALGFIQPLTEMSTRDDFRAKGGWYIGLTTLPFAYAHCPEILRASKSWSPNSLPRPV